ncbi:MAG: hypothetical protein EXS42_05160 [Lacunisphaera sp.]|nr:hypothetical protein [Lacunisphaera sp.]
MKNFREVHCERHGIADAQYERTLVWRCLHWQAKPFFWLRSLNQDYYSADFEFIRVVGELRSRREFRNEAAEFHYHPNNRGFLRTMLRMRVSSHKVERVFEYEITAATSGTPFGAA